MVYRIGERPQGDRRREHREDGQRPPESFDQSFVRDSDTGLYVTRDRQKEQQRKKQQTPGRRWRKRGKRIARGFRRWAPLVTAIASVVILNWQFKVNADAVRVMDQQRQAADKGNAINVTFNEPEVFATKVTTSERQLSISFSNTGKSTARSTWVTLGETLRPSELVDPRSREATLARRAQQRSYILGVKLHGGPPSIHGGGRRAEVLDAKEAWVHWREKKPMTTSSTDIAPGQSATLTVPSFMPYEDMATTFMIYGDIRYDDAFGAEQRRRYCYARQNGEWKPCPIILHPAASVRR